MAVLTRRGFVNETVIGVAGLVLGCANKKTDDERKEPDMPSIAGLGNGVVSVPSKHNAAETLQRLEKVLNEKGVHIFARIDHAEGAPKAGLKLRPTVVVLFGNPQVGTPLMQSNQTIGIDLPLKALVWEDEAGKTWLTYNDPAFLAGRHQITDRKETVDGMRSALEGLARAATG
jgi:uncharacterized protein (DUF302 family)